VRAFAKSEEGQAANQKSMSSKEIEWAIKQLGPQAPLFHPEEFMLWRKQYSTQHLPLTDLVDLYADFLSSVSYPDGKRAIRLASPQFIQTFGKLSASEAEYRSKMANYYLPSSIYRGVPSNKWMNDVDFARLFVAPTPLTIGNGVPWQNAPASVGPVFQQFNAGLLGDPIFLKKQAYDHSRGLDSAYSMSGMTSFSRNEEAAKPWMFLASDSNIGVLFTAKNRIVASIETDRHRQTPKLGELRGVHGEFETAIVAGTDPEAIDQIVMTDRETGRVKTAQRISYNRVKVTEEKNGKIITSEFEIFPDGRIRFIPK
jgi:hypothetical protein